MEPKDTKSQDLDPREGGRLMAAMMLDPKDTFGGTKADGTTFSARADLYLIRKAWECEPAPFEKLADGFGPGLGTHGDWSGIRDSSEAAIAKMYRIARTILSLCALAAIAQVEAESKALHGPVKAQESWN